MCLHWTRTQHPLPIRTHIHTRPAHTHQNQTSTHTPDQHTNIKTRPTHTHTHPHTHTRKEKKRIQSAITHSCTARNWSGALGCWGLAHYYHVCLDFYRLFFPSLALSPCFSLSLGFSHSLILSLPIFPHPFTLH